MTETRAIDESLSLDYLRHMAKWGQGNLHAGGGMGTNILIDRMELSAGQTILDVGCGTGSSMVRVAAAVQVDVDGVDVLPEMVHRARQRIRWCGLQKRCRVFLASQGSVLPFGSGTYDRIYTEGVIGFQSPATVSAMLADIFRLLKPGGLYVANETIWKKLTPEPVAASVYQSSVADFGLSQAGEAAWDVDRWTGAMVSAGFVMVLCETMDTLQNGGASRLRRGSSAKLWMSRAATMMFRLRGFTKPSLVRDWLGYRRRLYRHRFDRQLVEARLFVLRKPPRPNP